MALGCLFMPSQRFKGFKVFKGLKRLEGLEGFKGFKGWQTCNFHVQMPGSLNWRTKHARKMFTRCGLGAACWLTARWV